MSKTTYKYSFVFAFVDNVTVGTILDNWNKYKNLFYIETDEQYPESIVTSYSYLNECLHRNKKVTVLDFTTEHSEFV